MKLYIVAAISIAASIVVACSSSSETVALSPMNGGDAGGSTPVGDDDDEPNPNPTNEIPIIILADGGTKTLDPDSGAPHDPVPPYATRVVSFSPGKCAGFGASKMPNIVLGPPVGGGHGAGSTDVVALGTGGEIVLSFEPNVLVDGPGVDLLVFENAFFAAGAEQPFAEIGEVSVSEDGINWTTFPCTATEYPWGACAGWHAVASDNATSLDPDVIGGDPFDLADIGVTRAKFVRIVDKGGQACSPVSNPRTNGFDLDAIAAVHIE